MKYLTFSTPKAGVEDARNEDAQVVRALGEDDLMVVVSDGASAGVFSRDWSRHLATGIDSAWLESEEVFLKGLTSLRDSFQPEITRPTAQRKFLMEGSYATVMAVLIHRPFWWPASSSRKMRAVRRFA